MDFRIADTFTDSLARLTGEEQKQVKTTAFDLQINPAGAGMSFHRIDRAKDKNFWSVRVSGDIRLIVHKTAGSLLLCYVDHHDKAYAWAERRKIETHPNTGAAQIVEIRETVQEIFVPAYVQQPKPALAHVSEKELLGYGVPADWIADVLKAGEDAILRIASHLPAEAAEAVLELATGGTPRRGTFAYSTPSAVGPASQAVLRDKGMPDLNQSTYPFDHPDAQRRFRVINDLEELERALAYPWEKWTVFLHPDQKQLVERDYNGPARVAGSAGTGKTIVALHRAVHLARSHPENRVLLATFSGTLASALHTKLKRLISNEPQLAERLEVHAMDALGERLYTRLCGPLHLAPREHLRQSLADAAQAAGVSYGPNFLLSEWDNVVDAWQITRWEDYRDARRLGRKTHLPEAQRARLWSAFESVQRQLAAQGQITPAAMFTQLAGALAMRNQPPYDFTVVDEAQDISVAQLRFLAAMGGHRPNALFFAGDLGQRIFQQPFSWKSLGVDVRGRSKTLHVNYRTSHQIRKEADRLLGPEISDVDGLTEDRRGTISIFNGPPPAIMTLEDAPAEIAAVAQWIQARVKEGLLPHEFGVFVRSDAQLLRAVDAVQRAGLPHKMLDARVETTSGFVSISTMHLAKGLEFRAVVVMACDDEVIPLQARIQEVADEADLEEVYNTERHLLYVACTRARDHLLVTSTALASEFLGDLAGN